METGRLDALGQPAPGLDRVGMSASTPPSWLPAPTAS